MKNIVEKVVEGLEFEPDVPVKKAIGTVKGEIIAVELEYKPKLSSKSWFVSADYSEKGRHYPECSFHSYKTKFFAMQYFSRLVKKHNMDVVK